LSHKTLLISACESDDYHWIVEDDVEFLKPTYNAIKIFIENNLDLDWDILYTDVDFNAVRFMAPVFNFRRELLDGNYTTLQLGGSLYLNVKLICLGIFSFLKTYVMGN
jgi:GR25 family glycosyltransferase involved in LPS biosynthesis